MHQQLTCTHHGSLVTATDSVLTDNGHPDHIRLRKRTRIHCIKVYTDKQYTRSIWCLQLTHSETTAGSAAAWKRMWVKLSSTFSTCCELGGRGRCWPLCYPLSLIMQTVATGRRLNSQLVTYIPCLTRRLHSGSVCDCVLMSSSQVVVFTLPIS